MKVPLLVSGWPADCSGGQLSLQRHFNLPTNLAADQNVWLAIDSDATVISIALNDHILVEQPECGGALRFPVQQWLQARNCLQVVCEVESPKPNQANDDRFVLRNVQLEIDS